MTIRFLKRYVKKGIIILTITLFITKYVSYLSPSLVTSTKKTDANSDKMANGKAAVIDSVRSIRENKRVMKRSDLDASNIDALGSALSEFDEDDFQPSTKTMKDSKSPGIMLYLISKLNFFFNPCVGNTYFSYELGQIIIELCSSLFQYVS